jgi:hypothetical protein
MAFRNRSRFLNPRAMAFTFWIFEFIDSDPAFVIGFVK